MLGCSRLVSSPFFCGCLDNGNLQALDAIKGGWGDTSQSCLTLISPTQEIKSQVLQSLLNWRSCIAFAPDTSRQRSHLLPSPLAGQECKAQLPHLTAVTPEAPHWCWFSNVLWAQVCLRTWYQGRLLRSIWGVLGALCKGKGAVPLVGYFCTTWEALHRFFTKMWP